ncbi:class I SAM-dependent methyltransferase [Salinicoccus sp. HZC-1]|uniref:class I SAM-dependent methyltransferase n=1 Tax=Salinicoccus sp. HZC-1 TaxID=3385497 RepID=UPI00398A6329
MDVKQDVKNQFGRSADFYVSSDIHRNGGDLNTLVKMARAEGTENVLDVATGGGHTANALSPLVREVTAMDLTPKMLASAEQFIRGNGYSNVSFVEGDAEKMPFDDASFDIVTCRIAPHHFPNIEEFIKEVYRVLKTGGRFLLDDNVAPEADAFDHFYNKIEKIRDYSHYRAWKKTEWLRMLELEGFEIQELYRFEKHFEFEDWCNRMHLSAEEKTTLTGLMLEADEKVKQKFRVQSDSGKIQSFQGEAVLLSCIK